MGRADERRGVRDADAATVMGSQGPALSALDDIWAMAVTPGK